jgi:hypothetical protein
MSTLCKAYFEQVSEGRIPGPDSQEAKEFRAWSWAREQLSKIKSEVSE